MGLAQVYVVFVAGAAISLGMSWLLVTRLERVGERLGFSDAILGFVAALAADTPEITAAITALAGHQPAVGTGVVVGSNVFNLAALLGLGAIVAGAITLHRRVIVLAGFVAMWVALGCLLAVMGAIPPGFALAFVLVVLLPYITVLCVPPATWARPFRGRHWARWVIKAAHEEELELSVAIDRRRANRVDGYLAALALVLVVTASVAMERGAIQVGGHYGLADIVLGGLVLAAVTSLPNAVAAVYLAQSGRGRAALSVALNSNALNVCVGLLVPGSFVGLVRPDAPDILITAWYVGLTLFTLLLAYFGRGLSRKTGAAVVAGYAIFVFALLAIS